MIPSITAKGAGTIPDSTFHRRFHETAIPLHCPLYVIGQARERTDVVAPEIAQDKRASTFLISTRTEKELTSRHAWRFWLWSGLGLFLSLLFYGWWSGVPYLLVLALAWTWMVFNSMVFLRQRVNHAWSEVNVQLKRRADLIPKLVSVVQGYRNYEAALQPELAALKKPVGGEHARNARRRCSIAWTYYWRHCRALSGIEGKCVLRRPSEEPD